MTVNELAKMMLIYQYLFMTEKPNSASQAARKKLKKKLRHLITYREDFYNEAKEIQQSVYKTAWNSLFVKDEGTYISLGGFMSRIYNSIEKQTLVGHNVMKKMFDSYHHCSSSNVLSNKEEVEMEMNAQNLARECIRLIDGKVDTPLKARAYAIKQNLILEGKIT